MAFHAETEFVAERDGRRWYRCPRCLQEFTDETPTGFGEACSPVTRFAKIRTPAEDADAVGKFLPGNYRALGAFTDRDGEFVLIAGVDEAGWTLDDYVLPRLATSLFFGEEIKMTINRKEVA